MAHSSGRNIAKVGKSMVPKPKPEKKVMRALKKDIKITAISIFKR
jgi:hypothetical protein